MPFFRLCRFLAALTLAVAAVWPAAAGAQSAENPGSTILASQRQAIDDMAKQADEFEKRIVSNDDNDARLVEIRLKLEELAQNLLANAVAFRPRLAEINARLEQLGPPPAAGQPPEPDIVTAERQRLSRREGRDQRRSWDRRSTFHPRQQSDRPDRRYAQRPVSQHADQALRTVRRLRRRTARRRQGRIHQTSTARFPPGCASSSSSSCSPFWRRRSFALVAAAVLLVGGRRAFSRVFDADPLAEGDPSYLSRLSLAFWSTLLPTAALAAFPRVDDSSSSTISTCCAATSAIFLNSLFLVIGVVFCVNRLARAVLSPDLPNWRLMSIGSAHGAAAGVPGDQPWPSSSAQQLPHRSSTTRWARRCR